MPKVNYRNLNNVTRTNYCPISDYLKSVDLHKNRLWRLVAGEIRTLEDGEWMTEEKFEALHPLVNPINFMLAPANADKTKLYLH